MMRRAPSTLAVGTAPRRRRHWTAEQKAEYLALFSESGLPLLKFSQKMGVGVPSLSLWQRQARARRDEGARGESGEPGFAEVRVSGPIAPGRAVTIRMSGGLIVEAAAGTDPAWIGQLIKAIASW